MLLVILLVVLAAAAGVLGTVLEIAAWLIGLFVVAALVLGFVAYNGVKRLRGG